MLRWFVDPKVVEAVLRKPKGVLIEEDQVEVRPENLPDAIWMIMLMFILLGGTSVTMPGWLFRVLYIKNAQTQRTFVRCAIMI